MCTENLGCDSEYTCLPGGGRYVAGNRGGTDYRGQTSLKEIPIGGVLGEHRCVM